MRRYEWRRGGREKRGDGELAFGGGEEEEGRGGVAVRL